MRIRAGDHRDSGILLDLLDEAVAWLARQGRTGQWGTRPWSQRPEAAARIRGMAEREEPWIAEADGVPAGGLVLSGQPPAYVAPAGEPEVYVQLLVTSRAHAGQGIGRALLDHARDRARARGVGLLRVDCYRGGDGRLVDYYTRAGFTPTEAFEHNGWPGQVLAQRL